jgi:hypothetical protein
MRRGKKARRKDEEGESERYVGDEWGRGKGGRGRANDDADAEGGGIEWGLEVGME